MPKVLESKIILKSEDQATPNVEKGLDRLIRKMKKVQQEPLITDAQVARAVQQSEKISEQLEFGFMRTTGRGGGRGQPPPPTGGGRPLPAGATYRTPPPTSPRMPPGYAMKSSEEVRADRMMRDFGMPQEAARKWSRVFTETGGPGGGPPGGVPPTDASGGGDGGRGRGRGFGRFFGMGGHIISGATGPGEMMGTATGLAGQGAQMAGMAAGGMGPLAGVLGGAALPLAAILGGAALLGGGAMAAMKVAAPYKQFQQQFGALRYTFPGGEDALFKQMRSGAEFGYTPEETAGLTKQMQRVGGRVGMGAVPAFQQMRWMGMEAENWQPFAQAAQQAGIAQKEDDWIRIAKIIGVTISDKANFSQIARTMDQMTGLVSSFTERAGEMSETGLKELGVLTKWGEGMGSAMMTGQRGANFWSNVANVVGTTKDPHMEMFLYNTLNKSPTFRNYASKEGIGVAGRDLTPWEFELARSLERAPRETLLAVNEMPIGVEMRERLMSKMGMSPRASRRFRTLLEEGTKEGLTGADLMKKVEKGFEDTEKYKLEDLLKPPGELRATMATTQADMLVAGKQTAEAAVKLEAKLAEFVVRASPYLDFASKIVSKIIGVREDLLYPPVRVGDVAKLRASKGLGWNYGYNKFLDTPSPYPSSERFTAPM